MIIHDFDAMSDTYLACCYSPTALVNYTEGKYAPHYPVPAIILEPDLECGCTYERTRKGWMVSRWCDLERAIFGYSY